MSVAVFSVVGSGGGVGSDVAIPSRLFPWLVEVPTGTVAPMLGYSWWCQQQQFWPAKSRQGLQGFHALQSNMVSIRTDSDVHSGVYGVLHGVS